MGGGGRRAALAYFRVGRLAPTFSQSIFSSSCVHIRLAEFLLFHRKYSAIARSLRPPAHIQQQQHQQQQQHTNNISFVANHKPLFSRLLLFSATEVYSHSVDIIVQILRHNYYSVMSNSVYAGVEKGPAIEVFALNRAYLEDTHPRKANLGVGAYRTNEGKPWVLPVVRKTEIRIASDDTINHEYLPVLGNETFTRAATALLLGENAAAIDDKRAFGVQTLSGTGALRLGAEFLRRHMARRVVYYTDPTWENHRKLFLDAGFETASSYRYWDQKNRVIDIKGLLADLENAPSGAVIILHACAHNPTGSDPSHEEWIKIADVMDRKNLFPFFDSAYQGFASGDPNTDAWAVRYFVDRGFELLCAQSFAKNFGLYCERVGNLTVVQRNSATTEAVASQLTLLIRALYSNPPAFGSRIVGTILTDETLRREWMECIVTMSTRIKKMRAALHQKLTDLCTPGTWNHIVDQIGMFSYTGLSEKQVRILIDEYHIYLLKSGRINMCGLNEQNVEYVAEAIHAAVTKAESHI